MNDNETQLTIKTNNIKCKDPIAMDEIEGLCRAFGVKSAIVPKVSDLLSHNIFSVVPEATISSPASVSASGSSSSSSSSSQSNSQVSQQTSVNSSPSSFGAR
jgi:hypothetical protein